jgi:hypothetical protein
MQGYDSRVYHQGKKTGLFVFRRHKIIMLNSYDLLDTLSCRSCWLVGVKPAGSDYMSAWLSFFFPPSYHWCMVRIAHPLSHLAGMMAYINWVLRLFRQYPKLLLHGPVTSLIGSHPSSSSSSIPTTPWSETPQDKISWLLLRLHFAYFLGRFLGCLELFSNSPLGIFWECSLWFGLCSHGPASCLTITRTI